MPVSPGSPVSSVAEVVDGIASLLAATTDTGERQQHLDTARRRAENLGGAKPIVGEAPPVVHEHLDVAIDASGSLTPAFVDAVREVTPTLHWLRSYPAYDGDDPTMVRFIDNYAYTVIAGPATDRWPRSPITTTDVIFGFSLQAPNIYYPAHHHPAVEIYGVLGGSGSWKRGEADWQTRKPGSTFVHLAHESHAMETHDEPMLSWFAWLNDFGNVPELG